MNRTGKAIDRVIRILIAKRPKLTSELILATLVGQPGLEIVGESEEGDISNRVAKTLPNLLVISLDELGKRPGLGGTILHDIPRCGLSRRLLSRVDRSLLGPSQCPLR